jgi:hypothetical protein
MRLIMLSAMRSAFAAAFKGLAWLLMFPGRLVAHILGIPEADEVPRPAPPEDLTAGSKPSDDSTEAWERAADLVRGWCADSIIDDKPAGMSPALPLAVREWLPGLSRNECFAIIEADKQAVLGHVRGINAIAGVRPRHRLAAISEWLPEHYGDDPEPVVSDAGPVPEPLATLL